MKIFIILSVIIGFSAAKQDPDISVIRELYLRAAEEEAAGKKLLKMTEAYDVQRPLMFGYKGAGHMMMAKHVFSPFSKISHFNKGKKIFTAAIAHDPTNPELRFLRFSVQSEAPAFLGYKENIEEDKEILIREVHGIESQVLRKVILDYLLSSKTVSESERNRIRQNIN